MKKIKTIIIDDEKGARDVLRELITQLNPQFEICAEADSPENGFKAIQIHQPDLVFLDIQMPGGTGFDLLRKFNPPFSFRVIFATAHDRFAIDALRFAALDFLLKPINPIDLKAALTRFIDQLEKIKKREEDQRITTLLSNLAAGASQPLRIAIPDLKGFSLLYPDQAIFLEADGNYTYFHLINGTKIAATRLLKEYEEILSDKGFCRIHQSHMINLSYVKRFFKGNQPQVEMENGTVLNIARSKRDEFLKHFPDIQP